VLELELLHSHRFSNQSGTESTIPHKRKQNFQKSTSSGYPPPTFACLTFQICRDFESFEWFRSLLAAIEAQDIGDLIEIHTYLTQRVKEADAINIMVNDAGAEVDAITGLKAPTNFGRPNWDRVFRGIRQLHPATDVGVFFCGPKPLGHTLHLKCNEWSQPGKNGTKFTFGKVFLPEH